MAPTKTAQATMHDAGQRVWARELCSFSRIPRISPGSRDGMSGLLERHDTRVEKFAKRGYRSAIGVLFPNRV
jgi:hypothetical protein